MSEISTFRLYALRATYLLMVVGLGVTNWPMIVSPPADLSHMSSVVRAVLGAVSLLALLALRYPIKMLPLLFFEMGWKAIWLIRVALPLWSGDRLDPATTQTLYECLPIVLFPIIIPWSYVFENFAKKPGDAWRRLQSGSEA